ncbi:hypothetical protein [Schaalia odontolytica]|uniref:hypothetical protein n=1 Tax=Schaalia odontolytica TaxID=1660 RepID=UPI0028D72BB9|nr:hypothetical protein [Schaalia odontolytica]
MPTGRSVCLPTAQRLLVAVCRDMAPPPKNRHPAAPTCAALASSRIASARAREDRAALP